MGGGKRNYRAMRAKHRQWKKEERPIELEKKEVNKEDEDRLISLWQEMKNKKNKNKKEGK